MHLVGFIEKNFITMHGHMNVKFENINFAVNHNHTTRLSFFKQSGKCPIISIGQECLPIKLPAGTFPFCSESPAGDLCSHLHSTSNKYKAQCLESVVTLKGLVRFTKFTVWHKP